MLKIRRLNMDNSWQIIWGECSILLDPWLTGTEVDGFKWFNEQWHATPPLPINELGDYNTIIVSQPYSDHCHAETIKQLNKEANIFAVKPAYKRLSKELPGTTIYKIGDAVAGTWMHIHGLMFSKVTPNRLIDPIYHAIVIAKGNEAIVYAPHGFAFTDAQLAAIKHLSIKALITTFTDYKLPVILGGIINPGINAVSALCKQINPTHLFNTHDEKKHAKGIVSKIAKVVYPELQELKNSRFPNLQLAKDYSYFEL
jgi:hypothetical protein